MSRLYIFSQLGRRVPVVMVPKDLIQTKNAIKFMDNPFLSFAYHLRDSASRLAGR